MSKKLFLQISNVMAANDNDVFIIEQWAQDSLLQLENNVVAAGLVYRDFEDRIAQKGETVTAWVPTAFLMKRKADTSDIVTQDASSTAVSVVLNQHLYVSFIIRDGEESKSYKLLREEYIDPAVKTIADGLDQIVLGQVYQFMTNAVGKLDTAITMDTIIDAEVKMDENKVPTGDRNLVVAPRSKGYILKVDSFIEADKRGDNGDAMRNGEMGELFGFKTYMAQNTPSIRNATVAESGAVNLTAGYAVGSTAIAVDGFATQLTEGAWCTIAGDLRPRRILAVTSTTDGTTAITLDTGLDFAVADDAVVTVYKHALVNLTAGYALGTIGDIVIDNQTPKSGQLATMGGAADTTAADDPDYAAIGTPTATLLQVDRPLELATTNNDVIGLGPDGDYNFAFNRNAVALITRPLAKPQAAAGAMSYVASYNGLSMRVTITYDGTKQGHLVTIDMLCGVKTLNTDLGCVIYS